MPLIIKDKTIDHISGPVSFIALKPKNNLNLPIIMLFGDIHFSIKGMCDCKKEGCYKIYDSSFLQIIDSLSTSDHPVDFNIESWMLKYQREQLKEETFILKYKELAKKSKHPIKMVRENLYICYIKELRDSEVWKKYCPTKLMRYHYVDVRIADDSKYNLENRIHLIEQNLKIDEEIQPLSLSNLYHYKNLNIKDIEILITRLKKIYGDQYFNILQFKYLLVSSALTQSVVDFEKAIEYFFKFATPENSLIMKQYSKLPEKLKDETMWKNIFVSYFKYIFSKDNFYALRLLNHTRKKFYEILLKDDINEIVKFHLSDERKILQYTANSTESSIYLDLYYLLRTLKIENNTRLSLGYFGCEHVQNLKYLLTTVLNFYDVIGEVEIHTTDEYDKDAFNRCLKMPNINLNDYIK